MPKHKEEEYAHQPQVVEPPPPSQHDGQYSLQLQNPTIASLRGTVGSDSPVPKGLGPLIGTSHLVVKQCVELLEALSGYETANKYEILDTMGQRVFFAVEETNCCVVCCMRTRRCFKFKVTNYLGKPIFFIKRPCSCCWCIGSKICCDLWGNSVVVTMADGTKLGSVKQTCSICSCIPKFNIRDQNKNVILRIRGPKCALCCCCRCRLQGAVEFGLFDNDAEEHQGVINKRWGGLAEEAFSDADTYALTYDVNADPKVKALIVAAALLIDFMYFEDHVTDQVKKAK